MVRGRSLDAANVTTSEKLRHWRGRSREVKGHSTTKSLLITRRLTIGNVLIKVHEEWVGLRKRRGGASERNPSPSPLKQQAAAFRGKLVSAPA